LPRHDFEGPDRGVRFGAAVGFDQSDRDIAALVAQTSPFIEQGDGFADARGRAQIDPQSAPRARFARGRVA
jgi:hypothetical protein